MNRWLTIRSMMDGDERGRTVMEGEEVKERKRKR